MIHGTFNANTDGLLNRVASLGQGQASSAIAETVGNSVDAGASTVHIVLVNDKRTARRSIVVADDGHGILGWMPEDQTKLIADYVRHSNSMESDMASRAINNLFESLNPVSAMSFLFMCSSGALSAKSRPKFWNKAQEAVRTLWSTRTRSAETPQGTFGIGMTEAWNLGQAIYTSRPYIELAEAAYGLQFRDQQSVPVYQLMAPRFSFDPEKRNRNFDISEVTHQFPSGFRIPYVNVELPHGTIVEISDIDSSTRISEEYIVSSLQAMYGGMIYKGDLRILLYNVTITKTTTKTTLQPRELEAFRIIGKPLFEISPLVVEVDYKGHPYRAVIQINTVGKEGQPFPVSFMRRGVKKDPVTLIPDFFPETWGSPAITGLIEILTPADLEPERFQRSDQDFWDPKKDKPNISNPGIAMLLAAVSQYTAEIESLIGELKETRKNRRAAAINEIVNMAMQRSLNRFGEFFNLDAPPTPGVTKVTEGEKRQSDGAESRPIVPGINVIVLNEHGESSQMQYRIRVVNERGNTIINETFKGSRNLGPVSNKGKYKIFLDLPSGVSFALGVQNPYNATISPSDHVTIRFDVVTHEEKRRKKKLSSGLSVVFSPAGHDSTVWSLQHLESGEIWINTDYPDLARAMDRGEVVSSSFMIGHAIAAALSLASYGESDSVVMPKQYELGNTIAISIAEEWQGGSIEE